MFFCSFSDICVLSRKTRRIETEDKMATAAEEIYIRTLEDISKVFGPYVYYSRNNSNKCFSMGIQLRDFLSFRHDPVSITLSLSSLFQNTILSISYSTMGELKICGRIKTYSSLAATTITAASKKPDSAKIITHESTLLDTDLEPALLVLEQEYNSHEVIPVIIFGMEREGEITERSSRSSRWWKQQLFLVVFLLTIVIFIWDHINKEQRV